MNRKRIIKASLKRIKLKFDIKKNPIFFFNEDKKILFFNQAFSKIFNPRQHPQFLNHFSTYINNEKISMTDISINKMISHYLIIYFRKRIIDHIFKIFTYKCLDCQKNQIYFSIFYEISDVREKVVDESINSLVKASQLKDNDTGTHIQRINEYSRELTRYIHQSYPDRYPEIDAIFINTIGRVASMHDIGKIGIPDYILTKPGKLTKEEFKVMQEHTINGAFILSETAGQMARDIALFHHEKWNGQGYPYQLKEDQIPLCARIVKIADVYDALRMQRNYKKAFNHKKTIGMMTKNSGLEFDPDLFQLFLEIQKDFEYIYNTFSMKEEQGAELENNDQPFQ